MNTGGSEFLKGGSSNVDVAGSGVGLCVQAPSSALCRLCGLLAKSGWECVWVDAGRRLRLWEPARAQVISVWN